MAKTLGNSDTNGARKNVRDLVVYGTSDVFQLISKASSESEGWMKSTKAMEIPGVGVVIQVSTQQGDNVAEALTFVPGTTIVADEAVGPNGETVVVGRRVVSVYETSEYQTK